MYILCVVHNEENGALLLFSDWCIPNTHAPSTANSSSICMHLDHVHAGKLERENKSSYSEGEKCFEINNQAILAPPPFNASMLSETAPKISLNLRPEGKFKIHLFLHYW